jgi:ribonuclease-3
MNQELISNLEPIFPKYFKASKLYYQALTHKSVLIDDAKADFNERLEFYGDAVLKLAISDYLYANFPAEDEGKLSKYRSRLVSDKLLAKIAKQYHLAEHLIVGKTLKNCKLPDSILADAMEALIAVAYLENEYKYAKDFILDIWSDHFARAIKASIKENYKARLIEHLQAKYAKAPKFKTINIVREDHQPIFEMAVLFNDEMLGIGKALSKKEAGQRAAKEALANINSEIENK